jgi:multidrug efflux system membrane fusion protein
LLLPLWLVAGTSGCEGGAEAKPAARSAVPVTVAKVERRDVPVLVGALGTVEASSAVDIVPQVTGLVTEVHFKEGDFVKKGDLLFTVDTRPYQASLAVVQAELTKNRALANQARTEAERAVKLQHEGLMSEQEVVRTRAEADATTANVKVSEAQIRSASLNVAFARIKSPLDGRTGSVLVHAGNVVRVGEPEPLVVIRSLSPVFVKFAVPQEYLPQIRQRLAEKVLGVRVTPHGKGAKSIEGPVTFLESTVDVATGTLTLKASFTNEGMELWPGASVDVELVLGIDEQIMVAPEAAVQEGQDGTYSFVIDQGNRARLRRVVVSRVTASMALLSSGLEPGEVVVTDGHVRLRDGVEVVVKAEPAPTAEARSPAPSEVAAP